MDKIAQFVQWVRESDNIVFFGGAGVSTESGIPDFRSKDGLYSQKYDYPPETMLSHAFYKYHPEEFFRFYKDKLMPLDAKPNVTHYKLAKLEKAGKVKAVITQNVDGLHYAAGSKEVIELHGSMHRNYCERCLEEYDAWFVKEFEGVPTCPKCGGRIKPDVVLYDENLNFWHLQDAADYIRRADMLIVGGTSLAVYPAAGLIDNYGGSKLVLINQTQTSQDRRANLVIHESIGKVFSAITV